MSKRKTRLLGALMCAFAAMAIAGPAAQGATPKAGYEQFAGCPTVAENSKVFQCSTSIITGGHFQMGSKTVPISKPITLSGGIQFDGTIAFSPAGGLTSVQQEVPGGVIGLTGLEWLVNFLTFNQLKLYAVTELAGAPVLKAGILTLPLKVHLENAVLGNKCYVGSTAEPIILNLTTGTTSPPPPNEPIKGTAPTSSFNSTTKIIHQTGGVFVDNSFAAPGANGCALNLGLISVPIDGLVNLQSGLPSPAGTNETVQEYDQDAVGPKLVYAP